MVKTYKPLSIALTVITALIWFINGLFCKILNLVPRHELIVAKILGAEYAPVLTTTIGVAEILMVIWIVSGIKSRYCAAFQIIIVAIMNIIEFTLVPDLLLFGRLNIIFAFFFIVMIYINEFVLKNASSKYMISK
jgi:uncharacterized membrane protein YphA (DoxX/SURF4 family)